MSDNNKVLSEGIASRFDLDGGDAMPGVELGSNGGRSGCRSWVIFIGIDDFYIRKYSIR